MEEKLTFAAFKLMIADFFGNYCNQMKALLPTVKTCLNATRRFFYRRKSN